MWCFTMSGPPWRRLAGSYKALREGIEKEKNYSLFFFLEFFGLVKYFVSLLSPKGEF